jgi:tetratricopeptide (TPR) repeat protein
LNLLVAPERIRTSDPLLELQDLGARVLKGIDGTMRAWAALRTSTVESRFEALRASNLTGLVGREEEFGSDPDPSRAANSDVPARVLSQSTGGARSRCHGRSARWQQAYAGKHPAKHHRAHRRHSAVYRGDAVLEAESQRAAEGTVAAAPSPALAVPAGLHASLMARLDRLGPAKEIAQIGAAIGREFSHALLAAVVRKPDPELASVLDRLMAAGLLFREGVPPYATYLFKHALVQDAAYGTLLRERRGALHARIAETLEDQFAEIVESRPELLARHCTEAGLIEKAAFLWGKAGERSLDRSALVEATAQLTRALDQITALPPTPALRREEIKLQAALITPVLHVKGYAAPETKAAAERALLLIEQAEARGQPPEDALLLFSVLFGFWVANLAASDVLCEVAAQFLTLAEKQGAAAPLMIGHRIMGTTLFFTGDCAGALAHYTQSLGLYDPPEHRPLAARFGQDTRVEVYCRGALASWVLGHPEAARAGVDQALKEAREIGHAATLMLALENASIPHIFCGNYATANALLDELVVLVDEKGALFWKAWGMSDQGFLLALTGNAADAVQMITSGSTAWRSTGATVWLPLILSYLAKAYAELGQFDDAWRSIDEAMRTVEK